MAAGARDNPGVVAPPPLIALAAILLGLGLDWAFPIGLLAGVRGDVRLALAVVSALPGLWLGVRAIVAFRRIGTHVEPWKPSTALATESIYASVRNPMYLGLGLGTLAVAFALASDWMLIMLAPFALVIHFGVVLREERYLEARFGDQYRRYRERVPRYGWRR
jgi:protein-S-isoprenylcysteine O-methyltransferase Ste14